MSDLTPKLMGNDPKNEGFDPKIKEKWPQMTPKLKRNDPNQWNFPHICGVSVKLGRGHKFGGLFGSFRGFWSSMFPALKVTAPRKLQRPKTEQMGPKIGEIGPKMWWISPKCDRCAPKVVKIGGFRQIWAVLLRFMWWRSWVWCPIMSWRPKPGNEAQNHRKLPQNGENLPQNEQSCLKSWISGAKVGQICLHLGEFTSKSTEMALKWREARPKPTETQKWGKWPQNGGN